LEITSRVVGQAKRFSHEIVKRVKRGNLSASDSLRCLAAGWHQADLEQVW